MALLWINDRPNLIATITAAKTLGRVPALEDLIKLLMGLLSQTIGAVLAILFATWLLGAAPEDGGAPGGAARDTLLGGMLIGIVLSLGWSPRDGASGPLLTGLSFFVATSTFTGPLNPALILGRAILGLISGSGTFDQATLVAITAPLLGGAAGGWLKSYIGV